MDFEYLKKLVSKWGSQGRRDTPDFLKEVSEGEGWEKLKEGLEGLKLTLETSFLALPSSSERPSSEEELEKLKKDLLEIRRSMKLMQSILPIAYSANLEVCKRYNAIPKSLKELRRSHLNDLKGWKNFTATDAWMWRKSRGYKKWYREYVAKPDTKARLRANAEKRGKEYAREASRRSYWKKKGLKEPPPRRTQEVNLHPSLPTPKVEVPL